jgi:hypothetical protein
MKLLLILMKYFFKTEYWNNKRILVLKYWKQRIMDWKHDNLKQKMLKIWHKNFVIFLFKKLLEFQFKTSRYFKVVN